MAYSLDYAAWNGVFAVPNVILERYLASVSGYYIKVILYLFSHVGKTIPPIEEIAKATGSDVADAKEAVCFWHKEGFLIKTEEDAVVTPALKVETPSYKKEISLQKEEASPAGQIHLVTNRMPVISSAEIAQKINGNKQLKFLCEKMEQLFGEPLSSTKQRGIISMVEWIGLPVDVVLMISEYCVSIGKKNIRSIEKTAAEWADLDITTHERAEAKIAALQTQHSNENQVQRCFGISDRRLTPNEKKYIAIWFDEHHFSIDVIRLAYEKTVDTIGKMNFNYINKVLKSWKEQGVSDVKSAKKVLSGEKAEKAGKKASYDLDALDRIGLEVPKL